MCEGHVVSSEGARIYIRKEAAAQRQLDAAIRMRLASEDELAIHTVAAAAYRILRDLKEKHGRSELTDRLDLGIFLYASDLVSGKIDELPADVAESKMLAQIIADVSAAIRRGEVKSEKDVMQKLAINGETSFWNKFNWPTNFLKHADRQPGATLALDEVNNDLLLMHATAAYVELMGAGSSTPEMLVYFVFCGDNQDFTPKMRAIARLPLAKRRRSCLSLLRDLKARGTIALM
jgi:hypothetical protein